MAYQNLNEKDRFYIEQRLSEGDSLRSIGRQLGCSASTISRETRRHTPSDFDGLYCHRLASRLSQEKRANAKAGQAFQKISGKVKDLIHERLSTHTSPDVISKELINEYDVQVSESTIYRYISDDRDKGGELYKNLPQYQTEWVLSKGPPLLMKKPNLDILKLIQWSVEITSLIY